MGESRAAFHATWNRLENPSCSNAVAFLPETRSLTRRVVYKARHKATGEIVALKRVRMDREKDGVPVTAIRELRVLQRCRHPNVVNLLRVLTGSSADSVFLAFEFWCGADGLSLRTTHCPLL